MTLERLLKVFGNDGIDLEPEDFYSVRILVVEEIARRKKNKKRKL